MRHRIAHRTRVFVLTILVLAALVVGALLVHLTDRGGPQAQVIGLSGSEPSQTDRLAVVQGPTLDGETLSLDDLRGKPVLINVWASW